MDEALIKRVPPHSIEAEQSVVGAMLMDRDAITVAAEIIRLWRRLLSKGIWCNFRFSGRTF